MRISDWSSDVCSSDLSRIRTARTTGLWYLGLAICGLCGFLLIRSQRYAPGDPRQTLAQMGAQAWLARDGIAFELGIVIPQRLAEGWVFRCFRSEGPVVGWGQHVSGVVAVWGWH